jgi:transposase-like protein
MNFAIERLDAFFWPDRPNIQSRGKLARRAPGKRAMNGRYSRRSTSSALSQFKLTVLEYAVHLGATKACREFNVPRSTFCRWKQKYENGGRTGLYRKKTCRQ